MLRMSIVCYHLTFTNPQHCRHLLFVLLGCIGILSSALHRETEGIDVSDCVDEEDEEELEHSSRIISARAAKADSTLVPSLAEA